MTSEMKHDRISSPSSANSHEEEGLLSICEDLPPQKPMAHVGGSSPRCRWHFHIAVLVFPWVLSAVLLVLLAKAGTEKVSAVSTVGYWRNYELEVAKRELAPTYMPVRFSNGLILDGKGHVVLQTDDGRDQYISRGKSRAVDAAWDELCSDNVTRLTPDEAQEMGLDATNPATGQVEGELAVMHYLGCLNRTIFTDLLLKKMIRKAVYRDHYPESDSEIWAVHMDHCIDHLRQYIMCAADATFIPRSATYLTGSSSFGMMPEARPLQMCRDFGALRRWMRDRG